MGCLITLLLLSNVAVCCGPFLCLFFRILFIFSVNKELVSVVIAAGPGCICWNGSRADPERGGTCTQGKRTSMQPIYSPCPFHLENKPNIQHSTAARAGLNNNEQEIPLANVSFLQHIIPMSVHSCQSARRNTLPPFPSRRHA